MYMVLEELGGNKKKLLHDNIKTYQQGMKILGDEHHSGKNVLLASADDKHLYNIVEETDEHISHEDGRGSKI